MAQFDPAMRRETLVFQRLGIMNRQGKPCLKRAGYLWVEYDGVPDRYLEPLSWNADGHTSALGFWMRSPETEGCVAGFEYVDANNILDLHRFDRY